MFPQASDALLARALPLLRCPSCRGPLAAAPAGLACTCGRTIPFRHEAGHYDFLGSDADLSRGERWFFSPARARAYAQSREGLMMRLSSGRSFADEADLVTSGLSLRRDARVLDVPCGQGNFTEAVARRARGGVVLGVDLSASMLALAASRLREAGLDNVMLLRASALDLPIADGAIDAVSACGGLHLYPDVPRAIGETHRVLAPGGRVSGLTIREFSWARVARAQRAMLRLTGAQPFDFDALGDAFRAGGFIDWSWEPGPMMGWFRARR
jgi:SAM-dependent methyltransferase